MMTQENTEMSGNCFRLYSCYFRMSFDKLYLVKFFQHRENCTSSLKRNRILLNKHSLRKW